jgi:hypothetical protein
MDARILRSLIYLFSGLIVIFTLLMSVNHIGSLIGGETPVMPGQETAEERPENAEAMAQQALAAARYSAGSNVRASMIPGTRQGLSTAAVNADGAINVVRDKDFSGVAESPKDMMSMLNEMGGGKKKPAPIQLSESDFKKKIRNLGAEPGAEPKLRVSTMPEMGRGAAQEGLTMFTAPLEYKVFKTSETWWAFANSHKCRQGGDTSALKPQPSALSAPDFSRDAVVALISVSDLPNGIFRITRLQKSGRALVLSYKVDPMAMAAGDGAHDFYSAAVMPKDSIVKLLQVP